MLWHVAAAEGANTANIVVGVANLIGIDVINEPHFLWIAEQASGSQVHTVGSQKLPLERRAQPLRALKLQRGTG